MTPPIPPGQYPQNFNPNFVQPPQMQQQAAQPPQVDPFGRPLAPPAGLQQQQPQQQQQQGITLDSKIPVGDPNWPRELWGRSFRDAMRFWNTMAEDFKNRHIQQRQQPAPQGQPQAPQAQQQPQQPQFQQSQQPQQPQQQAPDTQQLINDAVRQALGPYAQVSAEVVKNRVAARFRDWWQFDQQIMEVLAGAGPEVAMTDQAWETAYYMVKGRAISQQNIQPYQPQPQYQQDGFQHYQQPQYQQPQQPQYGGAPIITPAPPVSSYFAEGPTPPSPNGPNGSQDLTNDPTVVNMARKWGLPPQELAQWWNGNVPTPNRGGY